MVHLHMFHLEHLLQTKRTSTEVTDVRGAQVTTSLECWRWKTCWSLLLFTKWAVKKRCYLPLYIYMIWIYVYIYIYTYIYTYIYNIYTLYNQSWPLEWLLSMPIMEGSVNPWKKKLTIGCFPPQTWSRMSLKRVSTKICLLPNASLPNVVRFNHQQGKVIK